ncbi:hypothetical protein JG688_00014766, partial [Phytophthora aleatoria]
LRIENPNGGNFGRSAAGVFVDDAGDLEYGKDHHSKCNFKTQRPTLLNLGAIPTGTPLLHPSGLSIDASHHVRFLSYVETQHEVSLVFEERLLAKFPEGALEFEQLRWKVQQVASAGPGAFLSQLAVLIQLTTELAKHGISVFQISTYQSDYGESVACGN